MAVAVIQCEFGRYSAEMLPDELNLPVLAEPYATALQLCLEHIFSSYQVVGIAATGTVVRGGGDTRSDLDIHVLHAGDFRERVQLRFNGVPCEIFVNPPHRVPAYFEEDKNDRKPIAPHMYATGVAVYDPSGMLAELVTQAKEILENPPGPPDHAASLHAKYSSATEFEDVEDLAERDQSAAAILLGAVIRTLVECRVYAEPGWRPRAKDLVSKLDEIDPISASLARNAASDLPFEQRLSFARRLCVRVTGADGFFEWTSTRDPVNVLPK